MHINKTLGPLLLCALFLLSPTLQAASCRAGAAAEIGSQAGYNRAKKAADAWNARENEASTRLQECLDKIRTLNIRLPSFISLSDILNGYADKICNAGISKINHYIPSDIDPWSNFSD